jgi:CDP-diacylglycerol--serine O-phosphatidyltransferase
VRLRPQTPESPRLRRRRRTLRTVQLLPTLMTAGNLVAGVLAIAYMVDAASATAAQAEQLFVKAAWLIFIGMFLDGLDGRVARMTGTTSDFGAQLDSLADCVTFGVAPAVIAKTLLGPAFPLMSTKLVFSFCLVYVLGAALRLARYNVESDRMKSTGRPHVTRVFRGLPSPAAGGAIAALVLLRHEYAVTDLVEWSLLVATPLLGLLMISRLPYTHVLNRYLDARRVHPLAVLLLVLFVYLVFEHFVETVAGIFTLYALSGPVLLLTWRVLHWPDWVEREDEDEVEEDVAPTVPEDLLGAGPEEAPPGGKPLGARPRGDLR